MAEQIDYSTLPIERTYEEDKKTLTSINRVVIQKIMSSSISRFFRKMDMQRLQSTFLSSSPSLDFSIEAYTQLVGKDTYYGRIVTLTFSWKLSDSEAVDSKGNVWRSRTLVNDMYLHPRSTRDEESLNEVVELVNGFRDLTRSLRETTGDKMWFIELSPDAREIRDKALRKEKTQKQIVDMIERGLTSRMRVGSLRGIPNEKAEDMSPGIYTISHRVSRRVTHTYEVSVSEDARLRPVVKRVS